MNGCDRVTLDGEGNEDDWLGQVLAERYRVDARVGRGGMGIVYRGTHLELGKRVAIKRLDFRLANETAAFARFRREAVAASRVDSPYVVQVFDWGKARDHSPFIVMELLEGQSLRQYFEQEGRLAALYAAKITVQVLKGLQRIHQAGVLHRDLKPENIFLCEYDQAAPFVKLLDFGISKQIDAHAESNGVTETGEVLGTAAYMSPEQAKGDQDLDVRSDLYSLGAVLYEALTGSVPHSGRTYAATLVAICTRNADDVRLHCPLLPEALANVVKCALNRDRAARYASAADFLEALLFAMPALRTEYPSGQHAQLSERRQSQETAPTIVRLRAKTAWVLGLLVATTAVLALVAYGQLRHRAPHRALTARVAIASALAPANGTVPSAAPDPPTTATSPQTSGSTKVPPITRASHRVVAPTATRKLVPTNASDGAPQSSAGVAGGLKLRRTMP